MKRINITQLFSLSGLFFLLFYTFLPEPPPPAYQDAGMMCPNPEEIAFNWSDFPELNQSNSTTYPDVTTLTDVYGTTLDVTVSVPEEGSDDHRVKPNCTGCDFPFLQQFSQNSDVYRYFRQDDDDIVTLTFDFSEDVFIDTFISGGQRPPGGNPNAVAYGVLTFWDGPAGTGNKVISGRANPGERSFTPETGTATTAINILEEGPNVRSSNAFLSTDNDYVLVGYESGQPRPWAVLLLDSVPVRSITWQLYVATVDVSPDISGGVHPEGYYGNNSLDLSQTQTMSALIGSGNVSAYISGFSFETCAAPLSAPCSPPPSSAVLDCNSDGSIETYYQGLNTQAYNGEETFVVPSGPGNVTGAYVEAFFRTHTNLGSCQPDTVKFVVHSGMNHDTCMADSMRVEIPIFNNDPSEFDGKVYRASFTGSVDSITLLNTSPASCNGNQAQPQHFGVYIFRDAGGAGTAQAVGLVDGFVGAIDMEDTVKIAIAPSSVMSDYTFAIPIVDLGNAGAEIEVIAETGETTGTQAFNVNSANSTSYGPDIFTYSITLPNVPANVDTVCIVMTSINNSSWFIPAFIKSEGSCMAQPTFVKVGDTTFVDVNYNGLQDAGDQPLEGVKVTVYDAGTGMPVTTDALGNGGYNNMRMTDASGMYMFDSLPAGTQYYVLFDASMTTDGNGPSYLPTLENVGGNTGAPDDSDVGPDLRSDTTAVLNGGEQDLTLDAGFFIPVSVGDYTWVDGDGDGKQGGVNDVPLAGVKVTLIDAAGNPMPPDVNGTPTAMQFTQADGSYLFENLPPGEYQVEFDISPVANSVIYQFVEVDAQGNSMDDMDSDANNQNTGNPQVGITPFTGFIPSGGEDISLDAGVQCIITVNAGTPTTLCQANVLNLSDLNAQISPNPPVTATWSTSGDGSFVGGTAFGAATGYTPGPGDRANGSVTLTLTTNAIGACGPESDSVEITILSADCGEFPWGGN